MIELKVGDVLDIGKSIGKLENAISKEREKTEFLERRLAKQVAQNAVLSTCLESFVKEDPGGYFGCKSEKTLRTVSLMEQDDADYIFTEDQEG